MININCSNWLLAAQLFALLSLALASDINTYRIKNSIIITFIIAGLATNIVISGLSGVVVSLLGILFPVLALIILFALRMLGAGDIKLFSAIGAVMGAGFVGYAMVYSFIYGGIIAIIIVAVRKNGKQRLAYLINYVKSCILSHSLLPYSDFADKSDGGKFRFSYAILCGTLTQFFRLFDV